MIRKNMNKFYCLNLGITKCYLIKCTGGYLLIDTGYYKDYKKFQNQMKKINIELSEIKYLLLTHHHDDHAGFAEKLVEKTGCKIIVHQNAVANLKKGKSEDNMKAINKRVKMVFAVFGLFHRKFEYPPVNITDKDTIILGNDYNFLRQVGIDGKIIYTPGHTKDSISVVLSDGNAFVGDVAMNFLKFCGIKNRPIYIENIDDVYKSWTTLQQEGAKVIFPSHGRHFGANKLNVYR